MSLRDAYEELFDLAPDERDRRLHAMDLSDRDRAQLRAMLAERKSDLFSHSLSDVLQSLHPDVPLFRSLVGRQVGPFTIVELIGEGGSAAVFRGYRAAGSGRQDVALKVLRASRLSPDASRRFEREQAILAQLSHPNIARFIEGGVDSAGLPYIAMEMVNGAPITEACATQALDLGARLNLISVLCRAMQAAHSALIVHCDLKPSNVLLDEHRQLKVLDFGIARLVNTSSDTEVTSTIALTPEYAAPEQFALGPPHIAVDIYAIGVLLAELVSGQRHAASKRERPSVAALAGGERQAGLPPPQALSRLLQGDIDAIVAKATAADPKDRYRSAEAMGKDVDRYLAGLPIEARRTSGWRRTIKFVRRHVVGTALAAAALCALCAVTGVALFQAAKAKRAAEAAEEQAVRADTVRNLAFSFFSEAEPGALQKGDVTVAQAVERAIQTLSSDRVTPPRIRIDLLMRLAVTLGRQGHPERALSLLEDVYGQAEAAFGRDDVLTLSVLERRVRYEIERGAYDAARTHIASLAKAVKEGPPSELRLEVLLRSASLGWKTADYERALRDSEGAIEMSHSLGEGELVHEAITTRAATLYAAGHIEQAVRAYSDLVENSIARFGPTHGDVSLAYSGLARAYRRAGRFAESEEAARSALRIDRAVYPKDHWIIANHLNALIMTLIEMRRFDEALSAAQEALEICQHTLDKDHVDVTTAKYTVGSVLLMMGRYDQAQGFLREALVEHTAAEGNDASDSLAARGGYGYAVAMGGSYEDGAKELDTAIAVNQARARPDVLLLAKTVERRARVALIHADAAAASSAIAALEKVEQGLPEGERKAWCSRTHTLRAELAFAAHDNSATSAALLDAKKGIERSGCSNDAIALEGDLLRALVQARSGDALSQETLRPLYARSQSLKFAPPEILALARGVRGLLHD